MTFLSKRPESLPLLQMDRQLLNSYAECKKKGKDWSQNCFFFRTQITILISYLKQFPSNALFIVSNSWANSVILPSVCCENSLCKDTDLVRRVTRVKQWSPVQSLTHKSTASLCMTVHFQEKLGVRCLGSTGTMNIFSFFFFTTVPP